MSERDLKLTCIRPESKSIRYAIDGAAVANNLAIAPSKRCRHAWLERLGQHNVHTARPEFSSYGFKQQCTPLVHMMPNV